MNEIMQPPRACLFEITESQKFNKKGKWRLNIFQGAIKLSWNNFHLFYVVTITEHFYK